MALGIPSEEPTVEERLSALDNNGKPNPFDELYILLNESELPTRRLTFLERVRQGKYQKPRPQASHDNHL